MATPVDNCKAQAAVEQAIRKWEMTGDTTATLYISSPCYEPPIIIPYIPSTVQVLDINCNTTRIPPLPQSLKKFRISIDNDLDEFPELPDSIEDLDWDASSTKNKHINFPQSLKKLSGGLTSDPADYERLPPGLLYLNVGVRLSASSIVFPKSLESLELCICNSPTENIESLVFPSLPEGLNTLIYKGRINNFPALPKSLKKLNIDMDVDKPLELPDLPDGLESLSIRYTNLWYLPCSLPSSLKFLDCYYTGLRRLPALPRGLRELHCDSTCLTYLPVLPSTLEHLSCSDCRLECLPRLPASLKILTCHFNNIKKFPIYPPHLDALDDNIRKHLQSLD